VAKWSKKKFVVSSGQLINFSTILSHLIILLKILQPNFSSHRKFNMAKTKSGASMSNAQKNERFTDLGDNVYRVPAITLPCLALHFRQHWPLHCPIHLSCKWNIRKPDPTRFGINVQYKKTDRNLLYALSNVQKDTTTSALDGPPIVIALTSYTFSWRGRAKKDENCSLGLVLNGIGTMDEKFLKFPEIDAKPLTEAKLSHAIQWLSPRKAVRGLDFTQLVTTYISTLSEVIPSTLSANQLRRFISEREWEGVESPPKHVEDPLTLRQFIIDQIAWQTGIVAHVVAGIHRFTAFDMVLVVLIT
jgi:hypothetical protein